MTLTKGQIAREGCVNFGDASLSVWEEGIRAARDAGGWEGANQWERKFKREVFTRIVQTLNRLGWTCVIPPDKIESYGRKFAEGRRYCTKGDLQADLDVSGRSITLKMFQNVNAPDRPDHGGRYQSDLEGHMPYVMRLEMERTRRRIRDYLCNVFTGYRFEDKKRSIYRKPLEMTALERIAQHYAESWHFKGDWDAYLKSNGGSMSYNRGSADGATLEHLQRVWFADRKGRIVEGVAHYNINNMWWVITGKYDYNNKACFELYTKPPENIRVKRNADIRRKRLEKELSRSIEKMDFERAATLRDILFPGAPKLFVVWHTEHQLFHCTNFNGYTADKSKAGKFTADEVRNWNTAPNVVMPLDATKEAA